LTRIPESLGHIPSLSILNITLEDCSCLTRLPFFFAFMRHLSQRHLRGLSALTFPPQTVITMGMPRIRKFLIKHHHPLKILLLILAARRRRMRHLPAELWALMRDDFFCA